MDFFTKKEKILLAALILWVAVISLYHLNTNPPYWFDEGIYHQIVSNLAAREIMGLRLTPASFSDASLISVGYPVFYPAVVAFNIFGDSVIVLRTVAIFFLLGFLLSVYYLVRRLYGIKEAFYSALLISLFSPLYGNGKSFLGEVPGLFYFVSGLFLLNCALTADRKRNFLLFFFGGLSCGLAVCSKPTFLVILPAMAIGILWKWRQFLSTATQCKNTVLMLAGMAAALLFWVFSQFDALTSVGRIFGHYSNPYYIKDIWPIIFLNLRRFVTETTPLHFLLLFLVAGFFLIVKIKRRRSLHFVEIVIMAFVAAIIVFYVRTAGWYRYFFPAHLLLFIFFPAGVEFIVSRVFVFSEKRIKLLVFFAVVILACVQLAVMRTERFNAGYDAQAEALSFLASLDRKEIILFYNVPYLTGRYRSDNYYQFVKMSDHLSYGDENMTLFNSGFFSYAFVDESQNFSVPICYDRMTTLRKVVVYRRDYSIVCK